MEESKNKSFNNSNNSQSENNQHSLPKPKINLPQNNKKNVQKITETDGSKNTHQKSASNAEQKPKPKKYYNPNRKRVQFKKKREGGYNRGQVQKFHTKKISVLVPLFNEEESIKPLTTEIKKVARSISPEVEIFFVDDGSTDKSYDVIKELSRTDKRIRYISFRKNYGKSAALAAGFESVSGNVVITMDADLQDDPEEIPNLLKKIEEGFDLVSGWKRKRKDPFIKKYTSKVFNYVTRLMTGIKIHDFNCGLKAYKKEVVENISVHGELHRYIPVLAGWKGFKITEIIVKHHPRRYGKTKFGISRFFKGFVDLITVIFNTRYIKRPLHLFGFLGVISFIAGFIVNGYLSYEWIIGKNLSNRPLLFLGILLIIVGVQFFSVGLLGEIIAHNLKAKSDYGIKDKK